MIAQVLANPTESVVTLIVIIVICLILFVYRDFIKGAIREFKHVVWPTRKETQKFFGLVLVILTAFGVYLFIASNIFSGVIFSLKDIFGTGEQVTGQSGLTEEEIDALFSDEVQIETSSTASGDTLSWASESSTGSNNQ